MSIKIDSAISKLTEIVFRKMANPSDTHVKSSYCKQ